MNGLPPSLPSGACARVRVLLQLRSIGRIWSIRSGIKPSTSTAIAQLTLHGGDVYVSAWGRMKGSVRRGATLRLFRFMRGDGRDDIGRKVQREGQRRRRGVPRHGFCFLLVDGGWLRGGDQSIDREGRFCVAEVQCGSRRL